MILKQFELLIEPISKERPRFATRSGQIRTYTPKRTRIYEDMLSSLVAPHCDEQPLEGPLRVSLEFQLSPPKQLRRKLPDVRPDIDNYIKAVFDAFNPKKLNWFQGMWKDDAQVVELIAKKVYAEGQPKILVKIEAV